MVLPGQGGRSRYYCRWTSIEELYVEIEGKYFTSVNIANDFLHADVVFVLSHPTGHVAAGIRSRIRMWPWVPPAEAANKCNTPTSNRKWIERSVLPVVSH